MKKTELENRIVILETLVNNQKEEIRHLKLEIGTLTRMLENIDRNKLDKSYQLQWVPNTIPNFPYPTPYCTSSTDLHSSAPGLV